MAKKMRKTLPKGFADILRSGDLAAMQAVFAAVDVNAGGGVFRRSALAFPECPDALARWLVDRGADLHLPDQYGETPLYARAGAIAGDVGVLTELGADVHHDAGGRGTALHYAAKVGNATAVHALLAAGADPNAGNARGQTHRRPSIMLSEKKAKPDL